MSYGIYVMYPKYQSVECILQYILLYIPEIFPFFLSDQLVIGKCVFRMVLSTSIFVAVCVCVYHVQPQFKPPQIPVSLALSGVHVYPTIIGTAAAGMTKVFPSCVRIVRQVFALHFRQLVCKPRAPHIHARDARKTRR